MFLIISVLCVQILAASKIHLHYCIPPTACTDISNCQNQFFSQIKTSFCGYGGSSIKICCLPMPTTTTAKPTPVTTRNNYKLDHKNFQLLPIDKCGVIASRLRITAGRNTSPGEFPWMALITYQTGNDSNQLEFKCAGTLITENYVLTAAHCMGYDTLYGVRLGEYDMEETDCDPNERNCHPPVQNLLIDKTIIHTYYNRTTFINDIALVKLLTPANYSYGNVRPICLPLGDLLDVNLEGQKLIVTGWGATEQGHKSTTLRKVLVPVMSNSLCQRLYQNLKPITKNQICAGADQGRDSCDGDSGGPLQKVDDINNSPRYVQYGIVSFGPTQCGLSNRPGIYTNVQKYVRWILDNLE